MTQKEGRTVRRRYRVSDRQKRWLAAYFSTANLNATAAAREVGYRWPNHSGPENLQKLKKHVDLLLELELQKIRHRDPTPLYQLSDEVRVYIDGL